ncbi:uncharacterized protein RCC_06790 [Ramularia collo-cygni]|uniref:DUF6604 domain-containing protein n=1 Tax=Ramularia collo-cygni TaxID=112498 RepID=A0A2D3VGC3_9PEZI|nr:uncharacterized protein RCC_06790 [Ramularia collo-cygni]CZT20929.1 uncharacterized protein RCC_06790 [Ramularia collo-cygni]
MVPKPLIGRYKLYKAGTSRLVEWLSITGGRCCDLKKVLKSLNSGVSTKKQSEKSIKDVEVGTQELLKLAEAIASSDSVPVPQEIIDITREVIAGREKCAEWYSAQPLSDNGKLKKENINHRYFIQVLQKVLRLLLQACDKQPPAAQATQPSRDATDAAKKKRKSPQEISSGKLNNLFNLLQLDEPSPIMEGDPPPSYQEATSPPQMNFKLVAEEDTSFVVWCFLQDLADIRAYVLSTWLEYSKGEVSFLIASSVTDTAFGLMRCAEEDFAKDSTVSRATDFKSLMRYFNLQYCVAGRVLWICPAASQRSTRPPPSDLNIVELLCPIAFACLESFRYDATAACAAAVGKRSLGSREMINPYHGFHEFCDILYQLSPELHAFSHAPMCDHVVVDEFVQGLAQLHRDGNFAMWLVVACQIYLDIYDMLGQHIGYGADALRKTFKRNKEIGTGLSAYGYNSGYHFDDAHEAVQKLAWVSQGQNRFEKNFSQRCGGKCGIPSSLQTSKVVDGVTVSPFEQKLPAHAGAILADLKLGLLDAGCTIANSGSIVLSTAHLYKALRAMGALKTDWPDIDFVLSSFKAKQPLITKMGTSYDADAAVKRYLMALGVEAKAFASDARQNGKLHEPRKISISSPLLRRMADRQANQGKPGTSDSKSRTVEIVLQTLTRSDATSGKSSGLLDHSFTPVQLLTTFKKAIQSEEPLLNFDYVSFTVTCAVLLDEITRVVSPSVGMTDWAKDKLGTKMIDESHSINLVAGLLQCKSTSPDIDIAAQVFSGYISAQGRYFTQQAFDQSSGRIPKALRPKIQHDLTTTENSRSLMRTYLEYANAQYVFSGNAVSAYHRKMTPALCIRGCSCKPSAEHAEPVPKLLCSYGSGLPAIIIDEAVVNIEKNPDKLILTMNAGIQQHFEEHAQGLISEKLLRERIKGLTLLDIQP